MEILVVRHGESTGNSEGRLQGHVDAPLTAKGREQARRLGDWLKARDLRWDAAIASPLARARETAEIIALRSGFPAPTFEDDLREVKAGALEGLTREEMSERHPTFFNTRTITDLGDFAEFGGESYDEVQARVGRVLSGLVTRHRESAERVLLVAHGGFNFQFMKRAVCIEVPRVCLISWGNCTCSLLRFRDRRGTYMAEVAWHVPLEIISELSGEGTSGAFR
jgi:2,3-bisphosphoglycerate-dependent phosphoglycerate mutase